MSAVAGELLVKVTADTRTLTRDVTRQAEAAGEKAGASMGKRLAVGLGAAVAAAGVGKFLGDAIAGASDLAETANKIDAVFGGASGAVNTFAANAARDLGQSRQAALDAAATMGVFGKQAGLTGKDLAGFSTDLTGLASDLASFYNEEPSAVVEALGSALRGEAEPMRRFGVLLDAASIEAKGLELGLTKTIKTADGTKEVFDKSKQAIAAQALIMEQTADAQGDFARTSDGLANQQRILKAEFADQTAALGQSLLPAALVVIRIMRTAANVVLPALSKAFEVLEPVITGVASAFEALVNWVVENKDVLLVVAGVITAVFLPALVALGIQAGIAGAAMVAGWVGAAASAAAALATYTATAIAIGLHYLRMGIAAMVTGAQMAAAWLVAIWPIALIIAAIAGVVAAVVLLWKRSETFRAIVTAVWEGIKDAILAVVDWLTDTAWPAIQAVWDAFMDVLRVVWKVVTTYVALWLAVFLWGFNKIADIARALWDWLRPYWEQALEAIRAAVQWAVDKVLAIWDGLKRMVSAIVDFLSGVLSNVKDWLGRVVSWVADKAAALLDFLTEPYRRLWAAIKGPLNTVKDNVAGWVGDLIDKFRGAVSKVVEAGKDIVRGLWDGIRGMGSWLWDRIAGFIKDNVPGPVLKVLGISSPSRVFAGIGEDVVAGLQVGIVGERPGLVRTMEGLVPVPDTFGGQVGAAAAYGLTGPQIRVFIGNEELDAHIVRVTDGEGRAVAGRLLSGAVI